MGKKMLITTSMIIGLVLLALLALGIASHYTVADIGVVDGKLKACPGNPNCVCSEDYPDVDPAHQIPPIKVGGSEMQIPWKLLKQSIIDQGGEIMSEREAYLHAEFTSPIFRFVDDLEMRADRQNGVIHLRSASRVGRSDFGANRKRVESIWKSFGEKH